MTSTLSLPVRSKLQRACVVKVGVPLQFANPPKEPRGYGRYLVAALFVVMAVLGSVGLL